MAAGPRFYAGIPRVAAAAPSCRHEWSRCGQPACVALTHWLWWGGVSYHSHAHAGIPVGLNKPVPIAISAWQIRSEALHSVPGVPARCVGALLCASRKRWRLGLHSFWTSHGITLKGRERPVFGNTSSGHFSGMSMRRGGQQVATEVPAPEAGTADQAEFTGGSSG